MSAPQAAPAPAKAEGQAAEGFGGDADVLMDSVTKDEWKSIEVALSYTKKTVSEMLRRACSQLRSKGELVLDDSNGKFLGDMLPEMDGFATWCYKVCIRGGDMGRKTKAEERAVELGSRQAGGSMRECPCVCALSHRAYLVVAVAPAPPPPHAGTHPSQTALALPRAPGGGGARREEEGQGRRRQRQGRRQDVQDSCKDSDQD